MKYYYFLIAILFLLISMNINANQFALINDKDGFVNVRESPSLKSKIETMIKKGEPVLCASTDDSPQFCLINFNNNGYGYVHKSRLDFFTNYKKINLLSYTPKIYIKKLRNKIYLRHNIIWPIFMKITFTI